ncbi:MAG: 6-phosphofructokinase [Chloroflexota bacterium]
MPRKLAVGQSGGATAVINSSLVGVVREAMQAGVFSEIWGMRRGVEGALADDFVDLSSLSQEKLEAIAYTPGAALASSRHKATDEDIERLLDILRRRDIVSFLYIGGNDSADTVHRLAAHAGHRGQSLQAISIPKTIDNDLRGTDHCPGYGSIARYVAIATMDSAKDTESMPTMYPIKIIEVMGRDAGWVVAASALGKRSPLDAPHLLYPPERRLSLDQLLRDVDCVYRRYGYVVAVTAETLRDTEGRPFADPELRSELDKFGHPLIRGTADMMCRIIQSELGPRSRFDKPGSLQRMSMLCVSDTDLEEAEMVGRAAVRMALGGETDRMVTLIRESDDSYRCSTGSSELSDVANQQRLLPSNAILDDGSDVSDEFRRYAMPLLGRRPLPVYARLG